MLRKSTHLELPRRLVAFYLLFCTASIAWLTVSVYVISQRVVEARSENACLTLLGRASSQVEIEYLRHGDTNLQSFVDRFRVEGRLQECSIVSSDGTFLAHTSRHLVGNKASQPAEYVMQWGELQAYRRRDNAKQALREYQAPLKEQGEVVGALRMAIGEVTFMGTVGSLAWYSSLPLALPLILVGVGAYVLKRMTQPIAEVETQLREVAVAGNSAVVDLQPIRAQSGAAVGWNRVVEHVAHSEGNSHLEARIQDALASRQDSQFDEVFQSLSDGIAVTDAEGRIQMANTALAALIGADGDPQSMQGRDLRELLGTSSSLAMGETAFGDSSCSRTEVAEIQHAGAAGTRFLRGARHPLHSKVGTGAKGHVWTVRDVTQQKLADKMRDQFLDSATHELRTPLANIRAYSETLALAEMIDVEKQKEFCNTINSEATRLARFIDDLLSISSMEVGSLSIDRQNVDTKRLFEEVIDKVQPLMKKKGIVLTTILSEKMPEMSLDKDKISAALINLLGNAAKYTPQDGNVSLKIETEDNAMLIHIEDSGIGIAEEELPHVFDKFFRSADARVQEETGTGLGLSLAQEVVRLHDGDVKVRSEIDSGSTFTISLPLTPQVAQH